MTSHHPVPGDQRPQRPPNGYLRRPAASAAAEYLLAKLARAGTPALNIPQAIADGLLTDDDYLLTVQEFRELQKKVTK